MQRESESEENVSWNEIGEVLDTEMSTVEDIRADLARNDKGNTCQTINNCMLVFQRDPLLKGAIRKNELSGKIDIVGNLGWQRTSSSLTDTDVYQIHWYLEKNYGLKNDRNINKAMKIVASENKYHPIRDCLEKLKWDRLPRIDNLLPRYLGADHDDYTKEIMRLYQIPGDKIEVVHNAVNRDEMQRTYHITQLPHRGKRVLFMGRITFQKGPDYFVEAARLVHSVMPDVHFVMAGSGDMFYRMVRRVAELRMGTVFHFPGFQSGENVERMYASCDLYVMPSVSEPFGIAPLEAMICDIPVIMSRQSGVAEVVHNALKVDFWDIQELANKICAVLAYPKLAAAMVKNSHDDLRRIRWSTAADQLCEIYRSCLDRR